MAHIRNWDKAVFRNQAFLVLGVISSLIFLIIGLTVLPSPGQNGAAIGGAIISVLLWFLYVTCWWTKVTIRSDGVVIDNVFVRHAIPWSVFERFVLDFGMWAELKDKRRVWIFGQGGSLLGTITGYRSQHRVLAEMESASVKIKHSDNGSADYRMSVKISWWPLPVYLAVLESVILIAH